MAYKAFSDEWAQAYKDEINKSAVYKQAAAGWEGVVALIVEAEPEKNFPETKGVWMDLWHGEARDIKVVSEAEADKADFVIRGPYSRWKQVAQKELDSTKAMMQGKLKLRGDLPTIVRYTKASQEMTECTTRVEVEYPDEVPGVSAPEVVYPDGEEEASAMASMLAGLITANVEQHPERWEDFHKLSGTSVTIEVPDIEESLTLTFAGDDLVVRNGKQGRPAVTIRADSEVVMALNLVKTGPMGMPNYFDAAGRDVVKALVGGKLKIGGMWRVDTLNRVTRLFSVA